MMKLNVLLAKTEHAAGLYKKLIQSYIEAFKSNQGLFMGTKKTYEPKGEFPDKPELKGFTRVQNTVPKYLAYLEEINTDYINNLLCV